MEEGYFMKVKSQLLAIGLSLLLGGAVISPLTTRAQDPSQDLAKRRVRTRVVPEYPPLAKQMNVAGKVKIEATISADGRVTNTRAIGGSPLLINAAMEALKKWRFEPAPKETMEVIEFDFNGQGNN
jgi:TonB family protein